MDIMTQIFCPERLLEFLKGCSTEELKRNIDILKIDSRHLRTENEVFENFLNLNEPSFLTGMNESVDNAIQIAQQREEMKAKTSNTSQLTPQFVKEKESTKTVVACNLQVRINLQQKFDLVGREVENIEKALEKFIAYYNRQKKIYKAELEESGIRNSEIETHQEEFEREVVGACSNLTHRIPAESFVRFMNFWYRSAQLLLSKLRLNVSCNTQQYSKLKKQRFQKEPMRQSVEEVDFIQLETECILLKDKFDERNRLLQEMKRVYSRSHLLMTENRKTLLKQSEQMTKLENKIEKANKQSEKYIDESIILDDKIDRLEEKRIKIENFMKKHVCPSPMDYIKSKNELFLLKQQLKRWTRRIHVQSEGLNCYSLLFAQRKSRPSNSDNSLRYSGSTHSWQKEKDGDLASCGSKTSDMNSISTLDRKIK